MRAISRRRVLGTGVQAGIAGWMGMNLFGGRGMWALPLGLPMGLQLYSVRELLPGDYEGTLKKIAAVGFREVEGAGGLPSRSAAEVKRDMDEAGLKYVSAHYGWTQLEQQTDQVIAFHKEIGAHYIVCPSPVRKDGARGPLGIEDWRWMAGQFNEMGKKIKAAGLQFGYHNHTPEFKQTDGAVPMDELLRLTDPAVVTFELDCGWVAVGGADPVAYLTKYPTRISMLHVKDFSQQALQPGSGQAAAHAEDTALGKGGVDLKGVFAAAKRGGNIKHYFVEQEHFDMPPFEELKVDVDYLKSIS